MRLSDAIRMGGLLHPQAFGANFDVTFDGAIQSTCAMFGAGLSSGHLAVPIGSLSVFTHAWPWPVLHETVQVPPAIRRYYRDLVGDDNFWPSNQTVLEIIVSLNDDLRWTRDQIADWVAEQEIAHAEDLCVDPDGLPARV